MYNKVTFFTSDTLFILIMCEVVSYSADIKSKEVMFINKKIKEYK